MEGPFKYNWEAFWSWGGGGGGGGAGWAEGGGSSYWRRAPPILGLFQNVSQSAELARLKAHMSTERAS